MWKFKNPVYGDQIRVSRGLYYHYGIYASNDSVYQFAAPMGLEVSSENARVICTTLGEFLKGGNIEVREYDEAELNEKKSPEEIIKYAMDHLGEGGYDLVSNNCEHFANRCVFGVSTSSQVDDIFQMFAGLFR